MKTQRLWKFVKDMNFDGSITISDVWLWVKWLFFYPGDGVLYFVINKNPGVAAFFEITESSYSGILSGFITVFFCLVLLVLYGSYLSIREEARQKKEELDRRKKKIKSAEADGKGSEGADRDESIQRK